jgi:hypothetical protein
MIRRALVGLNFEDPLDSKTLSVVTIGEIDFNQIEGGIKGANVYSNLGREKWGILIDDFLYDNKDMTNNQGPKIALIDSGNSSI